MLESSRISRNPVGQRGHFRLICIVLGNFDVIGIWLIVAVSLPLISRAEATAIAAAAAVMTSPFFLYQVDYAYVLQFEGRTRGGGSLKKHLNSLTKEINPLSTTQVLAAPSRILSSPEISICIIIITVVAFAVVAIVQVHVVVVMRSRKEK